MFVGTFSSLQDLEQIDEDFIDPLDPIDQEEEAEGEQVDEAGHGYAWLGMAGHFAAMFGLWPGICSNKDLTMLKILLRRMRSGSNTFDFPRAQFAPFCFAIS